MDLASAETYEHLFRLIGSGMNSA
ncbi:MAG: hypothetical protein RL091_2535, partial [Verrucomicrobiota bacterium]